MRAFCCSLTKNEKRRAYLIAPFMEQGDTEFIARMKLQEVINGGP